MGNAVIKNVLVAALLVLLSFSIGISAAEDVKGSVFIIAGICGLVAMLYIGRNAWMLLIFLPIIFFHVAAPQFFLTGQGWTYLVSVLVWLFWCTLRVQGKVRFRWISLPILDVLFLLLVILTIYSFYRFPIFSGVLLDVIGISPTLVGGKVYIYAILASVSYVVYSCIPISLDDLQKWQKPFLRILFILAIVYYGLLLSRMIMGNISVDTGSDRISGYERGAILIFLYVYGTKNIKDICTSFRYLILLFIAVVGIMVSGGRTQIGFVVIMLLYLAVVKREIMAMLVAILLGYGALLGLSATGAMTSLPFGVQRVCSLFPGVVVKDSIARHAQDSTDIRVKISRWAMDERTGLIKDYVWGDGFGVSKSHLDRATKRHSERPYEGMTNILVATKQWHNGAVSMITQMGYVGLSIATFLMFAGIWASYKVLRAYRKHPIYPLIVLTMPQLALQPFLVFIICHEFVGFYAATVMYLILAKLFYCEGVKVGLIAPFGQRVAYVPLMVQERREHDADVPEYPLSPKFKKILSKQA